MREVKYYALYNTVDCGRQVLFHAIGCGVVTLMKKRRSFM